MANGLVDITYPLVLGIPAHERVPIYNNSPHTPCQAGLVDWWVKSLPMVIDAAFIMALYHARRLMQQPIHCLSIILLGLTSTPTVEINKLNPAA
jgi:hypothetical protein